MKNGATVGLLISDGSLLSVLAAMAGFEKVCSVVLLTVLEYY